MARSCRELAAGLKLEDVPGIGPRIASKLVEALGGEEEAVEALVCGRVSVVAEALGSPRRAVRLSRAALAAALGVEADEVFGSKDAEDIYERYLELVARYASSQPGRDRLYTLFPLPCRALDKSPWRMLALTLLPKLLSYGKDKLEKLSQALQTLKWPRRPRLRVRRVLAIVGGVEPSREELARVSGLVEVVRLESTAELARLVEEHELVLVYGVDYGLPLGAVPVYELSVGEVAPELVVAFFEENLGILEALVKVYDVLGTEANELLEVVGFRLPGVDVKVVYELASRYTREGPREGVDAEYDRLRRILRKLEDVVADVEVWASTEARRRLEQLRIELSAAELLRLLEKVGEGVLEYPEEVYRVYEEVAEEATRKLVEELELASDEAGILADLFPREPRLPVEADRSRVEELSRLLHRKLAVRRHLLLVEAATKLERYQQLVYDAAEALSVLDALVAMARFALDVGGGVAEVSRDYLGVCFVDGVEARLALSLRDKAQRVTYIAGVAPFMPDNVKGERVILLTGANSGGKTTLLHTIAEIVLAAQAGLPVPARRAWVGCFDRVYFFPKPPGMLGAGALEQTLKSLAEAVASRVRKLVLVDELEAITEAHAAARIIAGLASHLARDGDAVAVIVSHLAQEIVSAIPEKERGMVRVDGIEARGLDENYNLIVDRQPRYYHLARSTPELVVLRLLRTARRRPEKDFYQEILDLLKRGRP